MGEWLMILGLGGAACFGLWAWRLRREGHGAAAAALGFVLAAALGLTVSRLLYALLIEFGDFGYDGIALLWTNVTPDRLSFFGGCCGVCLGVALGCRLTGLPVLKGLDSFAPFGALLVAVARAAELTLGSLGGGAQLAEDSPFARLPFALIVTADGGYSYRLWAVCVLEALLALVCVPALLRLACRRRGLRFSAALFFLALPQIFCESLRKRGMRWGFVRPEQVLCAAVALVLVLIACALLRRERGFLRRWWPALAQAAGIGVLIGIEFALDKSDLPYAVCYAFMLAVLCGMGAAGFVAGIRLDRETA